MNIPSVDDRTATSLIALLFLGIALIALIFFAVPSANHDFLVFILGGLTGAVTTTGSSKTATALGGGSASTGEADPSAVAETKT